MLGSDEPRGGATMSLDAMTERALQSPGEGADGRTGLARRADAIVTYIPTEIVLVYVAAVAAVRTPAEGPATGQWVLLVATLVLTPIATWAVFAMKLSARGRPFPLSPRAWPWPELVIATLGFLLWAFTIPYTPFEQLDWYRPGLAAVVLLVGTVVLGLIAPLLRQADTPTWDLPARSRTEPTVEVEPE
jgi:hypothetical protein